MGTITRIKLPNTDTAYEIGAKFDVEGREITQTYATKAEIVNGTGGATIKSWTASDV